MSEGSELFAILWNRLGARPYDAMYRRGAPWEGQPRAELAALLESGRLAAPATGARALDVGCGSGADARLLSEHGFDVIGVDFSSVAVAKARAADGAARFVHADLFDLPLEVTEKPFDLIFDGGTIDDFPGPKRRELASIVTGLSRPGTVLVMWCFSVRRDRAPWVSASGPSRLFGLGIQPEEIQQSYAGHWDVEELPTADPAGRAACYWMTRRGG